MEIPSEIIELVERFGRNIETYKRDDYKETRVRVEFIDPFFEALGWDVRNVSGQSEQYKDVVHKDAISIAGEIDPKKICSVTDVTEAIKRLGQITKDKIQEAFKVLKKGELPDISPRYVNRINISNTSWFQDWLEVHKTLIPDMDEYSIYHLSYPNSEQIEILEEAGIELIQDVP